jgi:hypothetical protein
MTVAVVQHRVHARQPHRPARRGIALLFVLVAVVLGLSAATIAAQVAVTATVTRRLDRNVREADDVAASLAPRIVRWLVTESQRAVVPPDDKMPAIGITDETVDLGDGKGMRVRVTAFDQHGMVPWGEALAGGPMSGHLSPGTIEAIRLAPRTAGDAPVPPGLDLLDGVGSRAVWPAHAPLESGSVTRRFSGVAGMSDSDDTASADDGPRARHAIATLVATHVPGQRAAINVNTAPRELVAMAEALTGRSVWSVVEEARRQGKPASVGAFANVGSPEPASSDVEAASLPTFIASSDVWSFRVDVTIDRARSAWWLTYVRSDRGWTLRQRLRITG